MKLIILSLFLPVISYSLVDQIPKSAQEVYDKEWKKLQATTEWKNYNLAFIAQKKAWETLSRTKAYRNYDRAKKVYERLWRPYKNLNPAQKREIRKDLEKTEEHKAFVRADVALLQTKELKAFQQAQHKTKNALAKLKEHEAYKTAGRILEEVKNSVK